MKAAAPYGTNTAVIASAPSTRGVLRKQPTKKIEFFDSDDDFAMPIKPLPSKKKPATAPAPVI